MVPPIELRGVDGREAAGSWTSCRQSPRLMTAGCHMRRQCQFIPAVVTASDSCAFGTMFALS